MNNASLVIMAAGIGSRFGEGIKQLEPVGPNGEIIMDYSIYDAVKAGFNKVVFIIRKDIEKDFREIIGNRIEKVINVEYAFQELEDLPNGFDLPVGRTKPWGTGQAILSAKELIHEPFLVINADDYYGQSCYKLMYEYMTKYMVDSDIMNMCMAGFILGNTLSGNGGVTRGVCEVDTDGNIREIIETYNIHKDNLGLHAFTKDGKHKDVNEQQYVSMNMFGLPVSFMNVLEQGFPYFLSSLDITDIKSEYLLPNIIDKCIKENNARVHLLETRDKWMGLTYKEDKEEIVREIHKLIKYGRYPKKLY